MPAAAAILTGLGLAGFAAASVALAAFDLRERRLPDRLLLPALVAVPALLAAGAFAGGDGPAALARIAGGGAALLALHLALALVSGGALGGGDVKLAALAGAVLAGCAGWEALAWGAALAWLLAGAAALPGLARSRAPARPLPFAPALLAACWLVLAAHAALPVSPG